MEQRTRRTFTREFKAEAVARVRSSGKSLRQIARNMGLAKAGPQRWVAQVKVDAVHRAGLSPAERDELSRLQRDSN